MSRHNLVLVTQLSDAIGRYQAEQFPLPGIFNNVHKAVFIKQIIDSIRRVSYVSVIAQNTISNDRGDPNNNLFDPIKAAILHKLSGDIDEAGWLVFLFVHFGKHSRAEWRFIKEVYGKLGDNPYWTWSEITSNPQVFRDWLRANQTQIMRGSNRGFGNHRKYQSMDADKPAGTGAAILSYVEWVMQYGGHQQLFQHALNQSNGDPKRAFDWLYHSMNAVISFGRTAKFDYLTMLGKTELAMIQPGIAYLKGSTGPVAGARLMLQGSVANELALQEMENRLITLAQYLEVGLQEMEDSLCNWQKSPASYRLFSG